MAKDDKLSGKRKYSPFGNKEAPEKPPYAPDRVDRGLEADDTKPLYSSESMHPTQELSFTFHGEGDQPSAGSVPRVTSPIEEADELERKRRGSEQEDEELS